MLPSELLVARRYRDKIRPSYARLTDENLGFSRRILSLFETSIGRRKKSMEQAIRMLEEEARRDYRYVRGLATLLERRCQFRVEAASPPGEIREKLFNTVAQVGVPTTLIERSKILEKAATKLGISAKELEASLYADLEEEQVLRAFQPIGAEDLLRLYNLGLTQTLLFRCTEMEFTASGNWQQIFRYIKLLGLIYTIQGQDDCYSVRVDGPVSLFRLGTRYGTALAKLLPQIVEAPNWRIQAWIQRRRGDHQLLKLELDSIRHARFLRVSEPLAKDEYDSMVEKSFAHRFNALKTGWKLMREPSALPVGRHVMIPDFLFEKAGMRVYMEVAGFWTPEYLGRKLNQLREVEGLDMIVAVDRNHACQQLDNLGKKLNIFYYKRKIPLQPILNHLKLREANLMTEQIERLKREKIEIQGQIVYTTDLAQRLDMLEDAVLEELRRRNILGYKLLGDVLINDSTIDKIEKHLEKRMGEGPLTLKNAIELIEELGGVRPSRILEHLGYMIEWRGINPDTAEVKHRRN